MLLTLAVVLGGFDVFSFLHEQLPGHIIGNIVYLGGSEAPKDLGSLGGDDGLVVLVLQGRVGVSEGY